MAKRRRTGDSFETHIESASGTVHTGKGNIIRGAVHTGQGDILIQQWDAQTVTVADVEALRSLFDALHARVAAEAPPELADAAQAQVDELEKAAAAEKPDVSKMERVRNWFLKHLPTVAGSVTSLLVNPILGKIVEAAGDLAAGELRRRFGLPGQQETNE